MDYFNKSVSFDICFSCSVPQGESYRHVEADCFRKKPGQAIYAERKHAKKTIFRTVSIGTDALNKAAIEAATFKNGHF